MKKILLTVITSFMLIACSKNDNDNDNQYLPNNNFDTGTTINTNFPQYNDLKFSGNHVVVYGFGLNGIVVSYYGNSYTAFELSDPNHHFQSCSNLTLNGLIATCNCDDGNAYEIVSGQPTSDNTGPYGLQPYFVEVSGSIIRVYNN